MPPINQSAHNQIGWKAFFALLGICQIVLLGVMWRTYDAVIDTAQLARMHDYQINSEIKPKIDRIDALLLISEVTPDGKAKRPKG